MTTEANEVECCTCFFCKFAAGSPKEIFDHALIVHNFDMKKALATNNVTEQVDYIRIVNFLRKNSDVVEKGSLVFDNLQDDIYLYPVLENDPLLYFDVEELNIASTDGNDEVGKVNSCLQATLETTQQELNEAKQTIVKMRTLVHRWIGESTDSATASQELERKFLELFNSAARHDDSDSVSDSGSESGKVRNGHGCSDGNIKMPAQRHNAKEANGIYRAKIAPVDSSYFCSYAGYSVHKDMLQDSARTLAYLNFVKNNRPLFEGKVVIDVGCGTGILSMFAVRYGGARKVFAIEPSNMAFQAIDTIAENDIEADKITVINAPVESEEVAAVLAESAGSGCDVVISEWMGYFLIFENMLPSVLFARDKFMKKGGCMAPSKADLFIDATDSITAHNEYVGFWSDVYGFSMSAMQHRILLDAQLYCFAKSDIVSVSSSSLLSLDLSSCPPLDGHFSKNFEMKFSRATQITAFVGWFTVDFEGGPSNVTLSTAPGLPETHWKQTALFLPESVSVLPNESYSCSASVDRLENDHRSLSISIKFKEHTYRWALCRD